MDDPRHVHIPAFGKRREYVSLAKYPPVVRLVATLQRCACGAARAIGYVEICGTTHMVDGQWSQGDVGERSMAGLIAGLRRPEDRDAWRTDARLWRRDIDRWADDGGRVP